MNAIESQLLQLGMFDRLAAQSTPVHRLDPRAKLIVTLVFVVLVVSVPTHTPGMLIPFFIYPVYLAAAGNIPFGFLWRRLLAVSPFAVLVGLMNPLFERAPQAVFFGITLSAGWMSFGAILLRFILSVSAALALVGVTGLTRVCLALERLGVPSAFAVQLLLLYRYIFVLAEEALRLARARSLRAADRRGLGLRSYGALLGHLLLRTVDRAERIHAAMRCRGFDGRIRIRETLHASQRDGAFVVTWLLLLLLFRSINLPRLLGILITDWLQ